MDERTLRVLFSPKVIERGRAYFEAGYVGRLKREANGWTAVVEGTQDYRVFVPQGFSPVRDFDCTCPHFDGGNMCKHLAAVCFAVLDEGEVVDMLAGEPEIPQSPVQRAAQIVNALSEEQLRTIVLAQLREDPGFVGWLNARYGELDAKQAKRQFGKQATQLKKTYSRRGFIEWRDACEFEIDWLALAENTVQPFLERGSACDAFDLACAVFSRLRKIHIDDSDGFFSSAIGQCEGFWLEALSKGGAELEGHAFAWFKKVAEEEHIDESGDMSWLIRDTADEFLTEYFSGRPEWAGRVQESLDARIEAEAMRVAFEHEAMRKVDSGLRVLPSVSVGTYALERLVEKRLNTMRTLGSAADELRAYAEGFVSLSRIRAFLLADAEERGDFAYAIDMLEELRSAAMRDEQAAKKARNENAARQARMSFSIAYEEQLCRLYDKVGEGEKAYALLQDIVARGAGIEWLRELKKRTDAKTWPKLRSDLLAKMDDPTRRAVYVEERMVDDLIAAIGEDGQDHRWSYGLVAEEYKLLAQERPQALMQIVKRTCDRSLRLTGRSVYQDVAERMKRLVELEGGSEFVAKMRASYEQQYGNRPAMREEFAKALG